MAFRPEPLLCDGALVPALARRLLDDGPDLLPHTTVLLPSARAGHSLGHALLEAAAAPALLLPVILTPTMVLKDLGDRLPELDRVPAPDRVRALALAGELTRTEWLHDRPDAAPGHADALIRLFDDLRLAGLDPADPGDVLDPADELQSRDAERVAQAWRLYRARIPFDAVDRTLMIIEAVLARTPWPGRPCARLVAAGFVDVKPRMARLLHAMAAAATDEAVLFLPSVPATSCPAARLAATWSDPVAASRPDAPADRMLAALGDPPPAADAETTGEPLPLIERLAALPTPLSLPELLVLSDSEAESRELCFQVGEALAANPDARIGVATNDRGLARRVTARLHDAGIEVDDTTGLPLDGEPEGRLAHLLLRCALTGPAHGPLLELLTHPLATFGHTPGFLRGRALRLERELLHGHVDAADLVGLRARAAEKDAQLREREPDAGPALAALVDDVADGLEPLLSLTGSGLQRAETLVDALVESWRRVAPGSDLHDDTPTDDRTTAARRLLREVLADLRSAGDRLPPRSLADFGADLARLLRRETVLPRRAAALPVTVTGLLEARLESFDLLLLGGLTEANLPGRLNRGLLLGDRWRRRAALADWRDVLGQQAELFTRLLGNAPRTVLSWPLEQDGQPVLPSPMVSRLQLTGLEPRTPPEKPVLRRTLPDLAAVATGQAAFRAEPRPAPAYVAPRRPTSLSHSALKVWRDCPYRWLLERGFGLREEEGVIERLQRKDQGEIVHACLAAFLAPLGEGVGHLRAGRLDDAVAHLHQLAAQEFQVRAGQLPERRLWEAAFRRAVPLIVAEEAQRISEWSPAAVESEFAFRLADLAGLLPADVRPDLEDSEADVEIRGRLDRLDVRGGGDTREYHVIDYKTGAVPSKKDVESGADLQLALYALAAALGSVTTVQANDYVTASFVKVSATEYKREAHITLAGDDRAESAGLILDAALALLRGRAYPLAPGEPEARAPDVCRYCSVRDICRREERYRFGEVTT